MKALKIVLAVLAIVVVVLVVAVAFFLGPMIKTGVETMGPKLTGVTVTLSEAHISLFTGKVKLAGLKVGNPAGCKTDHAFSVGLIEVDLEMSSLLSKKIIIKRIHVGAPDVIYEASFGGSNIGKLMDQIQGGGAAKPKTEQAPAKESGKKVQIDDFLIDSGSIELSATMMGGKTMTIPLPTIHMTDIGADKQGASPGEVVTQIFGEISRSVTGAVSGAAKLVGEGAQKGVAIVGDGAKKGAAAARDVGGKVFGGVGSLFGKDKKP